MNDPNGPSPQDFAETVEQLRERLAAMKRLVGEGEGGGARLAGLAGGGADAKAKAAKAAKAASARDSIIDGNFLSAVFGVVLLLIICVSGYAFLNLYYAILKKFPAREHTEL